MKRCVCGYEAEDTKDLDEHIVTIARCDNHDHAEAHQ